MRVKIYQVHFDIKSKARCSQGWEPYDNDGKLTEFFESSVIVDLINRGKHKQSNYFGVFSHDVRKEVLFKEEDRVLTPENLQAVIEENPDIDVFAFQKRRQNPNVILQAEQYHPGFIKLIETILERTGFLSEIPRFLPYIILFNHFVARSEIYEQYVNELLVPAMKVLKTLPEAYKDTKYRKIDTETADRFAKAFGCRYYPYHPFVCERLPSLFLSKYDYKFKQIF